jgi:hypothetical protein
LSDVLRLQQSSQASSNLDIYSRARAIALPRSKAIERLRTDLMRDGVISGGDLSGFQNGQDRLSAKDDLATG